jgi:hypothetical protein
MGASPLIAVLSLAALAGCASCPPFRAAWYLHDPIQMPPTASASAALGPASGIYLALLNEGDKAVPLTKVVVNPVKQQSGDLGTEVPVGQLGGMWLPGELRVFYMGSHVDHCILPVMVQIECGESCKPRPKAVSGALPNALHETWLTSCPKPKNGATR